MEQFTRARCTQRSACAHKIIPHLWNFPTVRSSWTNLHGLTLLSDADSARKKGLTGPLIIAFDIVKEFTTNSEFVHGVLKSVLTDSGKKSKAKILLEVHQILGTKGPFTTTYHPKENGWTELFNRYILSSIRCYKADHPKDWDKF